MRTNHFTYHVNHHFIAAVRQVFTPVTTAYVKMTDTHALRAYQYGAENDGGRGGGLPWKLQ